MDATKQVAPFVFRNLSGLQVSFSARGIETTSIDNGREAQFLIDQGNMDGSERRFRKYDGQFPAVEIDLEFDAVGTASFLDFQGICADPIGELPTDKVGSTVRLVRLYRTQADGTVISQQIKVVWAVELEENRRVLILSSAAIVKSFGCGRPFEVGVRFPDDPDGQITTIGTTANNNTYHLPIWVESCFCPVDIVVRPSTANHNWSTFPVLCLVENYWSADATEVYYKWATEMMASTLGGVSCSLNTEGDQTHHHPVWLTCTFDNTSGQKNESQHESEATTTVTIWPALTIRNLLPCGVEWEVSTDGSGSSVFDSSSARTCHRSRSFLQCGGAVEVYTRDSLDNYTHARFKCVLTKKCNWSEWLVTKYDCPGPKLFNIQCKDDACDEPLTIGVKVSPRPDGKGVNLILYAEIWLRNLTSLPLTFGAPSLQVGTQEDLESTLPGKISADSALIELTSVLEANGFGLFGNDGDDDEDLGDDIVNTPLQQCEDVFEEVFEYVSLNPKGGVERRWWASDNHVSLRQEPVNAGQSNEAWLIDTAGEPFLDQGWESCANIAGSKSFTFNGRRLFNKSHRFRRRRWFRKVNTSNTNELYGSDSISDKVIFHQPVDLSWHDRSKRELERNAIGAQLDNKKEDSSNLLDIFNRPPQHEGILDIMTTVANDGSILVYVKHKDGKWSTPAIIPPTGSSNGVIRVSTSRWPLVTKSIREKRGSYVTSWQNNDCDAGNLGLAPLDPQTFELIYQVTVLSGLWGELSRMVTIMVSEFVVVS